MKHSNAASSPLSSSEYSQSSNFVPLNPEIEPQICLENHLNPSVVPPGSSDIPSGSNKPDCDKYQRCDGFGKKVFGGLLLCSSLQISVIERNNDQNPPLNALPGHKQPQQEEEEAAIQQPNVDVAAADDDSDNPINLYHNPINDQEDQKCPSHQ
ncbi:hypothetical protein ACH5RR_018177 [Cinchona calisaya]|uniref:Uncharacterized protein n=1 Tax=Cinchona calisaya TaxID=153742 RepID=A0ABD2ZM06_9GENT